ncbi:hypothetical protein MAR_003265 [Mya arenaria]|uniref:Furin-like cysteine-rich domain-containing protein n=1 Tax=Mya arenaria TaxID=6604 RepID=A0ABY7G8M3_MYAAR|nr:hypothetical protein MAR_003265 [Mya arenaria]
MQANGDCVYACRPGYYHSTCRETCQSQCVDNTCNITTGICTECEKGVNAGYLCPDGELSVYVLVIYMP